MPLVNVELLIAGVQPPRAVAAYLREGQRRIARFRRAHTIPGFIPTDYVRAYQALRALSASQPLLNRRFCEWGSGMGIVAGLASLLGFEAYGIEIEPELVAAATQLAADFRLTIPFVCGSYIPEEGDTGTRLGLAPADFGVIFAYPWPDQVASTDALFERVAADGAVLLTYHSGAEFRVQRKSSGSPLPALGERG